MQAIVGMIRDRDPSCSLGMLELTVTAALDDLVPADLHEQLSTSRTFTR